MLKKERMFCGVIIKFDFCRKNSAKMLTFKMSNINSKLQENVYTMGVERNAEYPEEEFTRGITRGNPMKMFT